LLPKIGLCSAAPIFPEFRKTGVSTASCGLRSDAINEGSANSVTIQTMSSAWVSGVDSNFGNQLTGHLTIERQEIIAEGFGPTFCCSASSKINGAFYQ
jgi:hypothetical protein